MSNRQKAGAQSSRRLLSPGQVICLLPIALCFLPLAHCLLKSYLRAPMAASRTVAFHTLGCKLNFSETSSLSRILENEGFEKKEFDDLADVYVINTCSVTDNADKECRQLVRRIQRKAPESLIIVTGCYAQVKPKEISEIPGVDLVLGAAEKFHITKHIKDLSRGDSAKI